MLNVLNEHQLEEAISTKPVGTPTEIKRMEAWLDERIARGKKSPIAEVVTLTPVLAQLLLKRNPVNRPYSRGNKNEIKQDIATGRYVFNGESIIVSDTGVLNDGQHRCSIVLETGIPISTVIVFGPKEETRFTVDTGKSKSVSNFLAMKGYKYTYVLGAAIGYILQSRETGTIVYSGEKKPSKQAVLQAVSKIRGVESSVEFTSPAMVTVRNHAVIAFCHYTFWQKSSRETADHFIMKLIDGDGLRKGDPILFCRNKLISWGRGIPAGERAEMVFKCWNAFRTDTTIQAFRATGRLPKVER